MNQIPCVSRALMLVALISIAAAGPLSAQPVPAPPERPDRPLSPATVPPPLPPVPAMPFARPVPPLPPTASRFDLHFQGGLHATPFPMDQFSDLSTVLSGNLYDQARASIDSGRYDRALDQLDRFIKQFDGKADAVKNRVDAAHYWKAYTQLKLQATADALTTLRDMQKKFADSRWLKDARALELEVRQASGQNVSPDAETDEDLKLLALRGLMQTSPDAAIPRIEQLLAGNSSVRVKENALFVLSQSRSPRAGEIISNVAKTNPNPDLQLRAVRYLGAMRSDATGTVLEEIYRTTSDEAVKRGIIQAFAGSRSFDKLTKLTQIERDDSLKKVIVRSVGTMGREQAGELLRSLYASEKSPELRREIVTALGNQQNASVLVALARAEKDPVLKRHMVSLLSHMKSKEATDYLLELIK